MAVVAEGLGDYWTGRRGHAFIFLAEEFILREAFLIPLSFFLSFFLSSPLSIHGTSWSRKHFCT